MTLEIAEAGGENHTLGTRVRAIGNVRDGAVSGLADFGEGKRKQATTVLTRAGPNAAWQLLAARREKRTSVQPACRATKTATDLIGAWPGHLEALHRPVFATSRKLALPGDSSSRSNKSNMDICAKFKSFG